MPSCSTGGNVRQVNRDHSLLQLRYLRCLRKDGERLLQLVVGPQDYGVPSVISPEISGNMGFQPCFGVFFVLRKLIFFEIDLLFFDERNELVHKYVVDFKISVEGLEIPFVFFFDFLRMRCEVISDKFIEKIPVSDRHREGCCIFRFHDVIGRDAAAAVDLSSARSFEYRTSRVAFFYMRDIVSLGFVSLERLTLVFFFSFRVRPLN